MRILTPSNFVCFVNSIIETKRKPFRELTLIKNIGKNSNLLIALGSTSVFSVAGAAYHWTIFWAGQEVGGGFLNLCIFLKYPYQGFSRGI